LVLRIELIEIHFCFSSQAEYLQGLLPRSAVVKAFNVLSAYVLENGGSQGTKEVQKFNILYAWSFLTHYLIT